MNKLKAWLIRKLGGCVYLEQSQKIVFKELPCLTLNFETVLPSHEWDKVISESEKIKIANREAANKIGRYIIDNGLYEITRDHNYNVQFDCEILRYKVKVVQPPNPPSLKDRFGSVDKIRNDPNCYNEALRFYALNETNGSD